MMGFGHSILAMSGEESLAQVYREIEHPKVKNLKRTGLVIVIYSLLFTSLVSFFAMVIIPDADRPKFYDNLIGGLAMHVVGPSWARLVFQAFVVVVGFLILAGAVNTAIVGSNGVLNRVSEDGVLPDWFRKPHRKYGTTYRLINLITLLQLFTIIVSRGNVYVLGEAYAFGVVWSFAFKSLSMFVLRFKQPNAPHARVEGPAQPGIGGRELPARPRPHHGRAVRRRGCQSLHEGDRDDLRRHLHAAVLRGVRRSPNARCTSAVPTRQAHAEHTDQFQLMRESDFGLEQLHARPGGVLVPVRDYNTLTHLHQVVHDTDTEQRDIVVLTIRLLTGPTRAVSDIDGEELFTDYEQQLFTRVVHRGTPGPHRQAAGRAGDQRVRCDRAGGRASPGAGNRDGRVGEDDGRGSGDRLGEAWDRTPHPADRLATRLVVYARGRPGARLCARRARAGFVADDIDADSQAVARGGQSRGPRAAPPRHRDGGARQLRATSLRGPEHDDAVARLPAAGWRCRESRDAGRAGCWARALSGPHRSVHSLARRHQRDDGRADLPDGRAGRCGDVPTVGRGHDVDRRDALLQFLLPAARRARFTIADPQNWIALFAFLAVSLVASNLSSVARARAEEAPTRRDEVARLFDLSRDILLITESDEANRAARGSSSPAASISTTSRSACRTAASGAWPRRDSR